MFNKELKEKNHVYDELITHLKKSVNASHWNINGELLKNHEELIKASEGGKSHINDRYLFAFTRGLAIGWGIGGVLTQNIGSLIACAGTTGFTIYLYNKYKKNILTDSLDAKMNYAGLLQAMAEYSEQAAYPFEASHKGDYKAIKEYIEGLHTDNIELGLDTSSIKDEDIILNSDDYTDETQESSRNDEMYKGK